MRVGMVVPVRDPGAVWDSWLKAYLEQTLVPDHLVVIDSSSRNETAVTARKAGATILSIDAASFDHGRSRQQGVEALGDVDFAVLATQDALPGHPKSIERLLAPLLHDPEVGASFGRQLPRPGAGAVEAHSRYFNYPPQDRVVGAADVPRLGLKAGFISNVLACYRISALLAVRGFPSPVVFGEDAIVGARLVLQGWKIAYVAGATVYHSHGYSVATEARRYFDIGVLHAKEPWIQARLGRATGEGLNYVRSELSYLSKNAPLRIPEALLRTASKLVMYRSGMRSARLPLSLCRRLSLNPGYWKKA